MPAKSLDSASDTRSAEASSVDPIDLHVGMRIRNRRKEIKSSQASMAAVADVSLQQIQKYEGGRNRVSASKLMQIARVLKVPVQYFFEGIPGATQVEENAAFLLTPEGEALVTAYLKISKPAFRGRVLDLVQTLAEDCEQTNERHAS